MLRAQIVAFRRPERLTQSPEEVGQPGAFVARRSRYLTGESVAHEQPQIDPFAAQRCGHLTQREREYRIRGRILLRRMQRERLQRGAPPTVRSAFSCRGDRLIRSVRFYQIARSLARDPPIRRMPGGGAVQEAEEPPARF
jgi:hypothetical protein